MKPSVNVKSNFHFRHRNFEQLIMPSYLFVTEDLVCSAIYLFLIVSIASQIVKFRGALLRGCQIIAFLRSKKFKCMVLFCLSSHGTSCIMNKTTRLYLQLRVLINKTIFSALFCHKSTINIAIINVNKYFFKKKFKRE